MGTIVKTCWKCKHHEIRNYAYGSDLVYDACKRKAIYKINIISGYKVIDYSKSGKNYKHLECYKERETGECGPEGNCFEMK